MKKVWFIVPVSLILIGCSGLALDQITGVADTVERVAPVVVTGAAAAFPQIAGIALLIGSGLGWLAGLWKKLNPVLKRAERDADTYYGVTNALVSSITELEKSNPKEWKVLTDKLSDLVGDKAKAVIRALRGLPPKE